MILDSKILQFLRLKALHYLSGNATLLREFLGRNNFEFALLGLHTCHSSVNLNVNIRHAKRSIYEDRSDFSVTSLNW